MPLHGAARLFNEVYKYLFVDVHARVRWISEASIFATEESITASNHFTTCTFQNNFKIMI